MTVFGNNSSSPLPPLLSVPPPPPIEDAHLSPPQHIRLIHKTLQKATVISPSEIPILDFSGGTSEQESPFIPDYHRERLKLSGTISRSLANSLFSQFCNETEIGDLTGALWDESAIRIYTHSSVSGLKLIPSLLSIRTQRRLLTVLLRRDLTLTDTHRTNLHAHYSLPPSPCDFFALSPTTTFPPLDPSIHTALPLTSVLTKKLRWLTLGGQYDWTAKRYQSQSTPDFPEDVAKLVHGLFPDIVPQAAILNLYTPGDTLAPHRDISEKSRKGLVSISIGCAGIFVIGIDGGDGKEGEVLAVRLNSGDVVVMGGESRWAWHSVPKILQGTCPEELEAWPNNQWDGWMKGKRVNLNIRQMWD